MLDSTLSDLVKCLCSPFRVFFYRSWENYTNVKQTQVRVCLRLIFYGEVAFTVAALNVRYFSISYVTFPFSLSYYGLLVLASYL